MSGFHYPVKVLKKKMAQKGYRPFALDCATGDPIELDRTTKSLIKTFSIPIAVTIFTVLIMYLVIIDPMLQTTLARNDLEETLVKVGEVPQVTIDNFRATGEVDSEINENGLTSIVLTLNPGGMHKSLQMALEIDTIKEVTTDDNTIAVTFLSSE